MKTHHIKNMVILFTCFASALIIPAGFANETGSLVTGLGNATYTGIEKQPVTLVNGRWEGHPHVEGGASRPSVGLLRDIYFTGDLDADGQEETVVILWQSAGGTGSNMYIAVMRPENSEYENISTALLGDRVQIKSGKLDSGKITLEVLQAGESDPMCCPTQLATRTWTLEGTQLKEDEMEVTGKLSLNILDGSDWLMTHINRQQPLPGDAEVTLSFNAGRISGKSACNRYSAEVQEGDQPGEIIIGPTMGTRMACPDHLMEVESLYLKALAQVTSFSFFSGSLALNGQNEDGTPFSVLFKPAGKEHE